MKWLIGIAALVLTALAILAGAAGTNILNGGSAPRTASSHTPPGEAQRFDDQLQVPKDPTPADFFLKVNVIGTQCSGGPNCVYTYAVQVLGRPKVAAPLDPAATVVYTVTGANQPTTAYFVVNKNGSVWNPGDVPSVAIGPQDSTFQATVTRVDES